MASVCVAIYINLKRRPMLTTSFRNPPFPLVCYGLVLSHDLVRTQSSLGMSEGFIESGGSNDEICPSLGSGV